MPIVFNLRIPDDLNERIRAAAAEDRRSINAEVLWLLEYALDLRKSTDTLTSHAIDKPGR